MNSTDAFAFALGALRGQRVRTGLTTLAMAVGVAAVVTLTALGEGARRYVVGEFESLGSTLLAVIPGKTETTGAAAFVSVTTRDLTLADADALRRRLPEVRRVAPFTMATATVAYRTRRRQVVVAGTTHEFLAVRRLTLSRGRFLPAGHLDGAPAVAVLGAAVARELFPAADPLGRIVRVAGERARVIGVLAPRGVQLGMDLDEVVLLPVSRAMRMFNRRSLFRILVDVHAHADLTRARNRVLAVVRERHRAEDVTVITQDAVLASFSGILRALTLAVAAIAGISLAVAGIGIMNVMLVAVTERTTEIGLLRALGAGRGQVAVLFLTEAGVLSAAGGLLGLLLATVAVGLLTAAYPALPARPPVWAPPSAVTVAITTGLLFAVSPARRAARLDPVAALSRR